MGRSRARERHFQKQGLVEKRAAYAQAYGSGEVKVGLIVGECPVPRDYAVERANSET